MYIFFILFVIIDFSIFYEHYTLIFYFLHIFFILILFIL